MKKIFLLTSLFALLSCQREEKLDYDPPWLYYTIKIVDMAGNDLLDPSAKGNIVSENPTLININGVERGSTIYTDDDFDYNQGKGLLIIDKWKSIDDNGNILDDFHFVEPGGPYSYSKTPKHRFDNAKVIIKWGGNIENDTIVFSGGWGEYKVPYISEIIINGKELEKDESFGRENHFIYTKVMFPKK